jgi:hypothetical protein
VWKKELGENRDRWTGFFKIHMEEEKSNAPKE